MKVLIATNEKQGERENDFSFTNEGEFVKFGMECDGEEIDGSCGCRRSVAGFDTLRGTTTFKVVEEDITEDKFIELYKESDKKAGWNFEDKDMTKMAKELISIAQSFPVNSVLEKRGNKIVMRK